MPNDETPATPPPQRPRFAKRMLLPVISGKWTVFWLLLCLALTATLIPLILKKPLWIELEIVVAVWGVLWACFLTKLLYKGEQVADDHQKHEPRDWFGLRDKNTGSFDGSGCNNADAEGCLILIGLILALFVIWILIEFAIPIIFFILYFLVRGMLVHVVHDQPRCQGNFGLSALRGTFWAAVYTVPLAFSIWFVHYVRMK